MPSYWVNSRCGCCASEFESWWAMLSQWLWIMVSYAESVVVNHGEVCWASGLWIMVCYAVPVVVNHGGLCSANSCESWWALMSQWLIIMVCYAEADVRNHSVNAVPVGVNHGELCYASGCESRCAMLRQWLWIIVNYAQPVGVKHYELYWDTGCELLCDILSRVCGNHDVLCKASGCESLCYADPGVWESWCVILSQWLGITVWTLFQWVWIMESYA
jgi:hypothetical protein